jgi:excisionase family DNA binding protein
LVGVRTIGGLKNLIDRGELAAVRIGPRRIRVRQSQLDEFLAVGERFYKDQAMDDGTPWFPVRAALTSVASAVAAEDQAALETAIRELQTATESLR